MPGCSNAVVAHIIVPFSGANFGIAQGAFLGSRVIDLFGLARVSVAAALIVVAAIAAVLFALLTRPRENLIGVPVPDAAGGIA